MDKIAPIVLFVYNRPEHTKRTVESLLKNTLAGKSALIIYSDGAKNEKDLQKVKTVRDYIKTIKGFDRIEIVLRDRNFGLANSVISGVNEIFKQNDKVIVMEDDISTSPIFLSFMNETLEYYKNNLKIFSISGYTLPVNMPEHYYKDVFVSYRASSWGWATWKERWQKVDWELKNIDTFWKNRNEQKIFNRGGEDLTEMLYDQIKGNIDSWAIRWAYAHYKNETFCLYPRVSFCKNIGMDRSGTHSGNTSKYDVQLDNSDIELRMEKHLELDENISEAIRSAVKPSITRKIIHFVKRVVRRNLVSYRL